MPDLWDTNPDNVFSTPGAEEVLLRDHRGRLRPPAYILIALVIALAAIFLLIVALLFAPD